MDDVKSTDDFTTDPPRQFTTDAEDGSVFSAYLGCFVSFLILSDDLPLSSVFFQKFSFIIGQIIQVTRESASEATSDLLDLGWLEYSN